MGTVPALQQGKKMLDYMHVGHGSGQRQLWWHHDEHGLHVTKPTTKDHAQILSASDSDHVTHQGRIDHGTKKISLSSAPGHEHGILHTSILNQLKEKFPGYEVHEFATSFEDMLFAANANVIASDRPVAKELGRQQIPQHRTLFTKTPVRWNDPARNSASDYLSIGHNRNSELWWHHPTKSLVTGSSVNKRGKLRTHAGIMDVKDVPFTHKGRIDHAQKKISVVPNQEDPPGPLMNLYMERKLKSEYPGYEVERFAAKIGELLFADERPHYLSIGHRTAGGKPVKTQAKRTPQQGHVWAYYKYKKSGPLVESKGDAHLYMEKGYAYHGRIDHEKKAISFVQDRDPLDRDGPTAERAHENHILRHFAEKYPDYEVHKFAAKNYSSEELFSVTDD